MPLKLQNRMQHYKIFHRTYYNFSGAVTLGPHYLRLRPREDYDLRIESSTLPITPPATLMCYRDVEGNSLATATFDYPPPSLRLRAKSSSSNLMRLPWTFSLPTTP